MQVSRGGVSLWYGTHDAHAPSGTVPAGRDQIVKIGLHPPDPAASIIVLYRINHGPPLTVQAHPTPPVAGKQYFHAHLTGFKAGDKVEYVAIYRSGSRQIPSNQEAESHVVTFKVAPATGGASAAHPETAHASAHDAHGPEPADLKESLRAVGMLGKDALLALARAANSTVSEIRRTDPELFACLANKIGAERRSDVLRVAKGGSKPFLEALQKIDFAPRPQAAAGLRQIIEAGLISQKCSASIIREAAAKLNALERSARLNDPAQSQLANSQPPIVSSPN